MTRKEAKLYIGELKMYGKSRGWDEEYLIACDIALNELEQESVIDKIRAEITDCLKALDEIEKSGLNIYLPNEMSGRRLTYQQCLEFIDKYKADKE